MIVEGNGTHSSTLAWKIPWMEEPVRLQSMGSTQARGGRELGDADSLLDCASSSCSNLNVAAPLREARSGCRPL